MNVMNFVISTNPTNKKTMPIRTNIDRMKDALSAESFAMPQGLSREEMRKLTIRLVMPCNI